MKKTYVILLYSAVHHMPQAICGKSGATYGHAVYDPKRNAHILKIPASKWEPDPQNSRIIRAGKDIMENSRRRSTLNVICEVEHEPSDAGMAIADEYDKMQTRVAELEQAMALLPKLQDAATRLWDTLLSGQAPGERSAASPAPVLEPDTVAGRLDKIPYRTLRDLAKTINDERKAGLEVGKIKTKAVLVDTLAGVPCILEYLPAIEDAEKKAA